MAGIGVVCRIKGTLFGSNGSNVYCIRAPQVIHRSLSKITLTSNFKLGVTDKPKKATHFGLYIKQTVPQLHKIHPGKKQSELFGMAAQSYKNMSDVERVKLNDLVQRANQNYKEAVSNYIESAEEDEAVLKAHKAESLIKQVTKRGLKPYFLFRDEKLKSPEIQALSPAEQEQKIAEDWRTAPVDVKKAYQDIYVQKVINCVKSSFGAISKLHEVKKCV